MTPASIRNNNPGAMYPGPSARKFGGDKFETLRSKDGTHKIATFPTPTHGAAALFHLLSTGYVNMTIEKAIAKWCGGYYVSAYLKVLEQKSGVKPTDVLTLAMVRDHTIAVPIARAMAWQEAGRDFPLSEQEWVEAHAMAFGDATAPSFAPGNDVPSPRPEARAEQAVAAVAKPAAASSGVVAGGLTWLSGNIPSVDTLASWQASAAKLGEVVTWAAGNWKTVLMAGVTYGFACHVLPWLAKGRV